MVDSPKGRTEICPCGEQLEGMRKRNAIVAGGPKGYSKERRNLVSRRGDMAEGRTS